VTERLYYHDAGLTEFIARIVETDETDAGAYTVLDRSAFYPTSGGQSYDTGFINGVEVHDVVELENGEVRHISREPTGSVGDTVEGKVDRERRWRNRQMHTAQHILSQAFIRMCDTETVSVHLGEEYGAVELAGSDITDDQIKEAEESANRIISDNLPVLTEFVDSDEAGKLPLRKVPQREGKLRIIRTGEYDYSACGGTHCNCTAEVGLLKILSSEKQRGNLLVKFLSGRQALDDYRLRFDVTDELARSLTCGVSDLGLKIERLSTENKSLRHEITTLQKETLPARVEKAAASSRSVGGISIVVHDASNMDASIVNRFASQIAAKVDGAVILLAGNRLILATTESSGLKSGELIRRLTDQAGLKGGGSDRLAQVGGVTGEQFPNYAKMLEAMIANG